MDVLSTPVGPTPGAATAGRTLSSDFDSFLRLLTAQIRNQDPLQPAEGTEFVAQLATFSNVEQAVRSNQLLEQMVARLDRGEMAAAADWIGMDVRHSGPVAQDGNPRTLSFDIPMTADAAELVMRDGDGAEVLRLSLDPRTDGYDWPGEASALPKGLYTVEVHSRAGAQTLDPVPVSHFEPVREVTLGDTGTELVLKSGAVLPVDRMEALRAGEG